MNVFRGIGKGPSTGFYRISKWMSSYHVIIAVAVLILLAVSVFRSSWSSNGHVYIALVGPLGGKLKTQGEEMLRGVQLCLNELNEAGGIQGRRVEVLSYDDRDDPETARKKALDIAKNPRVLLVLGHLSGPASLAGGEVYKEFEIPAISGSAQDDALSDDNEWFFRTTLSERKQTRFLAYYAKEILQQERMTVLSSTSEMSQRTAATFSEAFSALGGTIAQSLRIDLAAEGADQRFQQRLEALNPRDPKRDTGGPLMLFLSGDSQLLVQTLAIIRTKELNLTVMSDVSTLEHADFSIYPEEQRRPGYFLDGVYVAAPFGFFDIANSKAQHFRDLYSENFFQAPSPLAALYYDATLVALKGLKAVEFSKARDSVSEERRQLKEALASIDRIGDAVEGSGGPLFFDRNGSAERSAVVGLFENRKMLPALTQLWLTDPLKLANFRRERAAGRVLSVAGNELSRTQIVYTGIDLHEVSELDLENLTYSLDFDLWFRYRGDFDVEDIEFLNAVDPILFEKSLKEDSRSNPHKAPGGKLIAEQESAGVRYRLYHIKGRFKADFLTAFPVFFREHVLGLSFRHHSLTRHNLIYMPDELFMKQTRQKSFWEKMRQTQVLSPVSGWTIADGEFFHDSYEKISLANPQNLKLQKFTEEYSRFNAGIWIRKDEFTLRGVISFFQGKIPADFVVVLFLLSGVMFVALSLAGRVPVFTPVLPYLWIFHAMFAVLFLLSGERILVGFLLGANVGLFGLKLLALAFDVIWWFVGAFLLTLALERFVWLPLKKRTERPVPRILRHSMNFLIYAFALFAVVAFVFDRSVSSLVATSGVFAVIFAFSSKVDISNVFAGIGISFSSPFRIGDWVKIGDCEEGEVVDMTSRTTKIQTRDYSMLSIPNITVAGSVIENFNYPDARFRLQFTLETMPIYPPDRVQKILLDAVLSTSGVLQDPPPQMLFKGQGDSSAIYTVVFYIDDYGKKYVLKQDVWKRVWVHLERADIELATPRREILMVQQAEDDDNHPLTVLRKVSLFEPLSEAAKVKLSQRMRKRRIPAGETIVKQGETEKKVLSIIIEGSIGLWVNSADNTPIEVTRLGSGDVFGEMGLLTGNPRRFGAIALTESYLFDIVKDDIAPLLREHPELAERFSKSLTERQLAIQSQKGLHESQQMDKETLSSQILGKIQQFFGLKEPAGETEK